VDFAGLGLVIIDEQHRFGVAQRLALLGKAPAGTQPHQLVMTATPIPRTLAMSLYGDLDTSVLDELPPGRKPVTTRVLAASRRAELVERLQHVFAEGAQAYWVCTLIEESDALQAQAAEVCFNELIDALPGVAIELVHGRLSAAEKEARMQRFKSGEVKLLVATTVIEVGVDVPNASCMVIENAERLGLSQLHQLRGRVGRGQRQSVCLLLYQPPLGQMARARLGAMRDSNDGFFLAEEDLRLRGPGEWLGTRQAGELVFRVADLVRDERLLAPARELAGIIDRDYPERIEPLLARWLKGAELFADV
jgi:ATP-dependent DNA helicase RecG